jgi:hypothetical protein
VVDVRGELFGPTLGLLVWREPNGTPAAATMAQYNQRFWQDLAAVSIPPEQRPRRFPVVDRFIGGDNDRLDWQQGIEALAKGGFSGLMLPPDAKLRDYLLATGNRRTAWAVYNPPGYAFDYEEAVTPEAIAKWAAEEVAEPYLKAGYAATDMALFAMSDEPGWYYPSMFAALQKSPRGMARFCGYLQARGLTPRQLGAKDWSEVKPLGRAGARDLPSRRLFYWTARFFAWDSSRHFAACTAALEQAFYPGLPVFTNWNNFSGRFYIPGPVANNADKQNPDAAMGGHDWLEFGRLRGSTMLWTEDWFGDEQAWQWSFYCAKLRSAAALGGVQFGGYVIPRTAGSRPDGILQKIVAIAGSGGKAIKYFVFGPDYVFPGNCYSFKSNLLPTMARAHAMIGAAEDVLWPGTPPAPQVAIVAPRSSQVWDAKDIPIPDQIQDMTNTAPWRATVDYQAEVFCLYTALQHANLPADFLDEDDLANGETLRRYKVLYLTEPNLPTESHRALKRWVRGGGTLVAIGGAASADPYDEPADLLAEEFGIRRRPAARQLVGDVLGLEAVGKAASAFGELPVAGPTWEIEEADGVRSVVLPDGSPGAVEDTFGKGRLVWFAFWPGMSYFRSGTFAPGRLPEGFHPGLRQCLVDPVTKAGVAPPATVDRPLIETPVLLSEAGAAVTLLNWTNAQQEDLRLTVQLPFRAASVRSVAQGRGVPFRQTDSALECMLPLGAADVLAIRP